MTAMQEANGYSPAVIERRAHEITAVAQAYGFAKIFNLHLPTTRLDTMPLADIIQKVGSVFRETLPATIYLPYRDDVHSDHTVVFHAVSSCTKWFRYESVRKVLSYETVSETEFCLNPGASGFRPNTFVNIDDYLEKKIEIMKIYGAEMSSFPFPRSEEAIRALAAFRGSTAGCRAAEAFMLLKEIR
jgi:LmbE family N-acetylglucosaminyl deacetylase